MGIGSRGAQKKVAAFSPQCKELIMVIEVIRADGFTEEDRALLDRIFPHLERLFWNSVWQKGESEALVQQTLGACKLNLDEHGDPFSWLGNGTRVSSGNGLCNNPEGMRRIIDGGYIVVEDAPQGLKPPEDIVRVKGKPQVIRITRLLLDYARLEAHKI